MTGDTLKDLLIDEPSLRIERVRAPGGSRQVCVTFTERQNDSLDADGFGVGFLTRHGFDVIAVKCNTNSWYQHITDAHLATIIAALAGYEVRAGYGSSMGAYAAIRFAGVLELHHVVALSPIYDIRPEWERRFRPEAELITAMMAPEHVRPQTRYILVTDPMNPADRRHLACFEADMGPACTVLKVHFASHPVGPYLNNLGLLQPMVLKALATGEARLPKLAGRPRTADSLRRMAEALRMRRRFRAALLANTYAIRLRGDWAELYFQRSLLLQACGSVDDALVAGRLACAMAPQHPVYAAFIANMLIDAGRRAEAGRFLDDALTRMPEHPALVQVRTRI